MMALFALHDLLHKTTYKPEVRGLIDARIKALYEAFGGRIAYPTSGEATHYYALIDILELAEKVEKGLGAYMNKWFYPVDFVYCLAIDQGSVCLPGYGFFEPETETDERITPADRDRWSVRVSLANLAQERGEKQYTELGERIMAVLDKYKKDHDKTTAGT